MHTEKISDFFQVRIVSQLTLLDDYAKIIHNTNRKNIIIAYIAFVKRTYDFFSPSHSLSICKLFSPRLYVFADSTHTPHGDGNFAVILI